MTAGPKKTYVVEHLDPELGAWSTLEYIAIAEESEARGADFRLSSVPPDLILPTELQDNQGLVVEHRSVEELYKAEKNRVCLLDPAAKDELRPSDGEKFDIFLFGGILGDDPPRDRTSELRKKGYRGRTLGPMQMTTDTAVRVTRMVVQENQTLTSIKYIDHPEIRIDEHESTEMPFRYVEDDSGRPVMPKGMIDLLKIDSEKGVGDLL